MGSSSSNPSLNRVVLPKAYISMIPQAVNYEEGSCIKGVINLYVLQNINTSRIFLKITGSEKLEMFHKNKPIHRQNNFLRDLIPICEFPDYVIHQGHYMIPFNLQLPKILPGSFSLNKAEIYYKLKAILPLDETHKIKSVQPIKIFQKNRDPFVGQLPGMEMPFQICPIRKLQVKSRVILDKPGYLLNEPLNFSLEIKNDTKKRISKVQIRVSRHYSFDLKGEDIKQINILTLTERPIDVKPGNDYLNQNALKFSVPITKGVSPDIPTTEGEFISCSYKLEVFMSGSWRKAPKLLAESVVRIMPELLNYPTPQKLPKDWNPVCLAPLVNEHNIHLAQFSN